MFSGAKPTTPRRRSMICSSLLRPKRIQCSIRRCRLIGRQIAREQFERKLALERKAQKNRPAGEDA